jgi:hypothetical protein
LLTYQIFIVILFTYFICQSVYFMMLTITLGQICLVFVTFTVAFVVDQTKSFATLSLVYMVVVRRFGFLKVNEKEWLNKDLYLDKQEQAIPKLKNQFLKILESRFVEGFSMFVISIYSVFILFDLVFTDYFNPNPYIMAQIDSAFLSFFFIEILLKAFASSLSYFFDFFNCFDAIIVVISQILNLMGIVAKGLGVLRLIRVVVITVRKITGNQSKLRHQSKNNNPVDSVIKILQQLMDLPDISNNVKKEAKFAIEIIESNKLYELNIDMTNEEKNLDMEAKAWLNITTEAGNDTTTWFERDLDDFLKELHREAEELDQNQIEEEEERLRQIVQLNTRVWTNLIKLMDQFDKWDFDVFAYCEILQESTLVHFGFKLF